MSAAADLEKFTVVQLREQLKARHLSMTGKKPELIARLAQSFKTEAEDKILGGGSSTAGDLDHIAEEDVLGLDTTSNASSSPAKPIITKPKPALKAAETITAAPTLKKVASTENIAQLAGQVGAVDVKSKRAERFGLPPSQDEMKNKRAQRFGTGEKLVDEAKAKRAERFGLADADDGKSKLSEGELAEKRRQRAERFGIPVAASAAGEETMDTKKQQRAERFGIATSDVVLKKRAAKFGNGTSTGSAEVEAKKQKRAERFGT